MFGHDLQQVLAGQVVARLQVDDLYLAPVPDERRDILEGDVIAGLGVVEPAAGIALDQQRLFSLRRPRPPPHL